MEKISPLCSDKKKQSIKTYVNDKDTNFGPISADNCKSDVIKECHSQLYNIVSDKKRMRK